MNQRLWDDVCENDLLEPQHFPLTVVRLVLAVGANRDFNAIHFNTEVAQASGAPEMYANNFLLQGMWEKTVRQYIGLGGVIRKLSSFKMKSFNTAGATVVVHGRVLRKWLDDGKGYVEFEVWSENAGRVSVGPGRMLAIMPRSAD